MDTEVKLMTADMASSVAEYVKHDDPNFGLWRWCLQAMNIDAWKEANHV